jgi:hypothetical protein
MPEGLKTLNVPVSAPNGESNRVTDRHEPISEAWTPERVFPAALKSAQQAVTGASNGPKATDPWARIIAVAAMLVVVGAIALHQTGNGKFEDAQDDLREATIANRRAIERLIDALEAQQPDKAADFRAAERELNR